MLREPDTIRYSSPIPARSVARRLAPTTAGQPSSAPRRRWEITRSRDASLRLSRGTTLVCRRAWLALEFEQVTVSGAGRISAEGYLVVGERRLCLSGF